MLLSQFFIGISHLEPFLRKPILAMLELRLDGVSHTPVEPCGAFGLQRQWGKYDYALRLMGARTTIFIKAGVARMDDVSHIDKAPTHRTLTTCLPTSTLPTLSIAIELPRLKHWP